MKFSLENFRFIRDFLSTEAAKTYFFAMILSHITYCLITWSNTHATTLKPIETLYIYLEALKLLDKKTYRYHHCNILKKYELLNWENLIKYKNICLVYKISHTLQIQWGQSNQRGSAWFPSEKLYLGRLSSP